MSGYARIYRSLIGHPAFRNDAEAMTFAWMVVKAAWRPARVRYKGHPIDLERGQLAISVRDFATVMDRDKAWIERLLKRLKGETMIETRHETGVNVITICNYDKYQSDLTLGETPRETPQKTEARQRRDTEQEREEGKKGISEPKGSSPRPWACPDGVDRQVWADLLSNRKRKRLSNTPTAWKHFNDDLERVSRESGIPAAQLIERCAAKGWGGIYDPRGGAELPGREAGRRQPEMSFVDIVLAEAKARKSGKDGK
jgi:hypothetical protein